ncbi:MAG: cytochrome c oxidase subunit I [Burkholderiales bacterium]|jgi:hypothetical protein
MDSSEENRATRSSWPLWSILAICVVPVIAATALYLLWTPAHFVNSGVLFEPVPLAEVSLSRSDGGRFAFNELHGRWAFVSIDDAACDESCQEKLYLMRQIRLTQGKDADRIERVWLIRDGKAPSPQVLADYEGTRAIALSAGQSLEAQFPSDADVTDSIYLVDPLGNSMMRFPRGIDPSRMKKDVAKLLRISSGWRQIER